MRARYPAHLRAIQRLSGSNPGVLAGSEPSAVTVLDEQKPNLSGTEGEQLLLTLEFWREYRTLSHLAEDWDIHESTAQRTIERVENALINSGKFALPGRKATLEMRTEWTALLVDVAEVPCERPKKTASLLQREKEAPHAKNASSDSRNDAHHYVRLHWQRGNP